MISILFDNKDMFLLPVLILSNCYKAVYQREELDGSIITIKQSTKKRKTFGNLKEPTKFESKTLVNTLYIRCTLVHDTKSQFILSQTCLINSIIHQHSFSVRSTIKISTGVKL